MDVVKSFDDIFLDCTSLGVKLKTEEYAVSGQYAIVDQGQHDIAGYTNRTEGVYADVPAIIFGDHTRVIKYIDQPLFLGADGVKLLKAKEESANYKYLYYALRSIRIPNTGYNRHFKWLKESQIEYPDAEMQQKVVDTLDKVIGIITIRKQQLTALDTLIKARFVEMFGIPGTNVHGWGIVRLGSMCHINPSKSQDQRLENVAAISFVPMSAVSETGKIDASLIKRYDEVKSGFTYFAENDVLFAKITPCMENGKGAVAKGLYNGIGFGSTEFHVLRPISGQTNSSWLYMLTMFPQFRMDAANNMTGSAGQRRVPVSFLENYYVSVPPIELQDQFAAFVEQVDKSKYVAPHK